jgi:thiol-disulfide isomerase/thioredoxin
MKLHLIVFPALLLGCCLALAQSNQQRPKLAPIQTPSVPTGAPKLGEITAGDFEVQTLEGRRVKFGSLLGKNKPVLIDFWATWCGPCRATIPHLIETTKTYRERGLTVIGLTLEDPQENLEAVRLFAKKYGINYQIAFAPRELYFEFNNRNARTAIPQTYIYGTDGALVQKITGYNPKLIPELWNAAIEKALGPQQRDTN